MYVVHNRQSKIMISLLLHLAHQGYNNQTKRTVSYQQTTELRLVLVFSHFKRNFWRNESSQPRRLKWWNCRTQFLVWFDFILSAFITYHPYMCRNPNKNHSQFSILNFTQLFEYLWALPDNEMQSIYRILDYVPVPSIDTNFNHITGLLKNNPGFFS